MAKEYKDLVVGLDIGTSKVMAVVADSGITGMPVIVGHSMGGFVTVATAALNGDAVAGIIVCDSPITEPDPEVQSYRLKQAFGRPRTYEDFEEAVARFRTVPGQDHSLDYVMDHVARHSLRRVEGGWRWKFDENIFVQFATTMRGIALPYLHQVDCRVALLRSEYGLITPDIGQEMFEALGRATAAEVNLPVAILVWLMIVPMLLKIDFGALVGGYHSDMTRTFVLGSAAAWQRELYQLVAAAQLAGREALAVGATLSDVDAAAREVIAAAGHADHFGHGLGHGVGLQIHEAPGINSTAAGTLLAGSVVTVEPGVYLPDRGGVRIEDTLVVGERGPELLTRFPKELAILT